MARYVAFFDLDDTVFGVNSGKLMVRYAAQNKLLKKSHIFVLYFLAIAYKIHLIGEKQIMQSIAGFLSGLPEEKLDEYTGKIFDAYLKPSIRETAKECILHHKAKGATTVILSASTPYICRRVRQYLQMDGFICSELQVIDGCLSGQPLREYCYGEEKARRLLAYCEKNGFDPVQAWYYGDALSDRAAMAAVGNPVCVSPGRAMRRLARRNEWQIENW